MLKDIFEEKKCFKLICGAGNEDLEEVEKLVALYSKAGCRLFDLNASEEVLYAAEKGLNHSIPKEQQKDYNFCISIGTKNDFHLKKAKISEDICKKCGKCVGICLQKAINSDFQIDSKKCIGCLRCVDICPYNAVTTYLKNKNIRDIFEEIDFSKHKNLTNIELHSTGENLSELKADWKFLTENFDGMSGLCVGRSKIGNEQVYDILKALTLNRPEYSVIVQTDGSPMSGGKDDYKTTLQAVAMAECVGKLGLPVYILPSGGTNSKTAELARLCGVNINGVAIGSYARKIVKEYIMRDDFLTNKAIFNEALKIATSLFDTLQ